MSKDDDTTTTSADTGKVVAFKRPAASRKEAARGKTLCRRGFHKWRITHKKQFDVKSGKLVTLSECSRCGERRTRLT